MDTNESANKIIKIELGKEGKFLSGRSRAKDIVEKIPSNEWTCSEIQLNFKDVESCSQSFISELIFCLKEKGVPRGKIKSNSISDIEVERRFNTELGRLEML